MPSREAPTKIQFGDVFHSPWNTSRIFVTTYLGEPDYFYASVIIKVNDEEALSFPGTRYRQHVGTISDRWSLERIVMAYQRGPLKDLLDDLDYREKFINDLRKESEKPPLILRQNH